ncbi:MAG: hypothetical protein U9P88_01445 [Patescibacteria group bacterium]|nr:hypothetical protein [Patescibacteria group bacterium]
MKTHLQFPVWGRPILIAIAVIIISTIGLPILGLKKAEAELESKTTNISVKGDELLVLENNSLLPISSLSGPEPECVRKIKVVITAYSSAPWQTDDTPFITASGSFVKDGIIANNLLPFGAKIRIPELYGNKIFVVKDRMHSRKGDYHFDIWFSSYIGAKNFGVKRTYIEILKS